MLQPWQKGKIIRIQQETANTRRYWIALENTSNFEFIPGQFVTLDLPIHEKPNRRLRSYSIASWPDDTNIIELVIVLLEGGAGTTWLFNHAVVGTELTLRGPLGTFILQGHELENDLFLICTGTGVAPFRSMVQYIYLHQKALKKICIIFGCRTKGDLLYYDELKVLEEKMPGFFYIPTLSREQWDGHTGYVHAIYESLCQNTPTANFMLCGWKNMIDEAKQRILQLGYDKKQIHQELYG